MTNDNDENDDYMKPEVFVAVEYEELSVDKLNVDDGVYEEFPVNKLDTDGVDYSEIYVDNIGTFANIDSNGVEIAPFYEEIGFNQPEKNIKTDNTTVKQAGEIEYENTKKPIEQKSIEVEVTTSSEECRYLPMDAYKTNMPI